MKDAAMKKAFAILLLFAAALPGRDLPFQRGVNLTEWFQQSSARSINVNRYTEDDFRAIRGMGCDVVRLPVDLLHMAGPAPAYELDPLFLRFLDLAVDRAEAAGLHLVIDNHTFDPAVDTDPAIEPVLLAAWRQTARHFRNRSDLVLYEVQNEPHGISDAVWNAIQGRAVDAIRAEDPAHAIVVGPGGWNGYNNLALMPVYADTNLIYTFHFYDPFLFTHQGASWTDPPGTDLSGVPYPWDAARMPGLPASLKGTWWQDVYGAYPGQGNAAYVKSLLDVAVRFGTQRKVPLWCGEFGAYQIHSTSADRARWLAVVRSYLEEKGIAWTLWEYNGGFGLFEPGTAGNVATDVDTVVAAALGLTPPPQREPVTAPDTAGFTIYDDFIGHGILDASWHVTGEVDLYSTDDPAEGSTCIHVTGINQYAHVTFRFAGTRDLSALVDRGFVLDLWARCDAPDARVDVRFQDTKTDDPEDHPWRIRVTLDESTAEWDGGWRRLRFPLADFTEHGSWDNDQWYNPAGLFDWTTVDLLAVVAEHMPLDGVDLYFDGIRISDPNADAVRAESAGPSRFGLLPNYPNPFNPSTTVAFVLDRPGTVRFRVFDLKGAEHFDSESFFPSSGRHEMRWDGRDASGLPLPSGIYLCRLESADRTAARRMVLIK
jgi:endoglucanase